jgi:hypothetical protein
MKICVSVSPVVLVGLTAALVGGASGCKQSAPTSSASLGSVAPPSANVPFTAEAPALARSSLAAAPAAARRHHGKFSLAVIPDVQYLFDADRSNPAVAAATMRWIVDNTERYHIAFTAQLGDIVENHNPTEFAQADKVFQILDRNHIQYGYAAGNHDLSNSNLYDDQRGNEAYLRYFSPARVSRNPTFGGATPNGYNTYYIFEGGGEQWLLLALDWRASASTIQWAQNVIKQHPTLPVIITTHELVDDSGDGYGAPTGQAVLSQYGQSLWDNLIKNNDQIFLTINGHFWPPARTVILNNAGHPVLMQIANYQDRYFGGSGMLRLYQFDLDHDTIEVSTFSPYTLSIPREERNALARNEAELTDPNNHFVTNIDFKDRFSSFQAVPPPPPVPVTHVLIPDTVAYWRFDNSPVGLPLPEGPTAIAARDLSGNGNDLSRVTLANGQTTDLVYTDKYDAQQPSRGSLFFNGSRLNPTLGGAYLRTVDGAPINGMTFSNGYTIEAFVRFPADCCGANHQWMGILSRMGTGGQAGKFGDDPSEPVATLSVPPSPGFQWALYPTNLQAIETNWSHITPLDTWTHVAVVNDGHHTVMYIDGCPITRNPRTDSIGISTVGDFWMIGAYSYAGVVEQSFYGWMGDVRIVARPLDVDEFMISAR